MSGNMRVKLFWLGVSEAGVRSLLSNESRRYQLLRPQRNRRLLVMFMAIGMVLVALGGYLPSLRRSMTLAFAGEVTMYAIIGIWVILAVLGGYSLLRVSVRAIADAPDALLDERQIMVRDTSFRFAYYLMGWLTIGLTLVWLFNPEFKMFEPDQRGFLALGLILGFVSMPSMIMAWREKDI